LDEAGCALTGQHETLVHESRNVELDLRRRELLVRGVAAAIGDRAFDIFALLVDSRGELVSKDEIIRHLWSGAAIGDNALDAHISALRKALGPERGLLKTAYGRGYRVVGGWTAGVRDASRTGGGRPSLPVRSNLPLPASSLIGRDADSSSVIALLDEHRLITLVGTGGIGKTRLALDVAHRLLGQQLDGVWMVELGALSDPAMVPSATAAALGIDISNSDALEAIARFMKGKRLVLVLDTCEHLAAAAAQLAETLLGHSPSLRVLATSREPLRAEGEHLFSVTSSPSQWRVRRCTR
jgi:DNA-binding winged helix-turn-helix (wHTH) protein